MKLLRTPVLCFFMLFSAVSLHAQSFNFSCTRDSTIGRCETPTCFTLKGIIPDIHASSLSYTVNAVCFNPNIQPNDPTGDTTTLTFDDIYSNVINIGFPFPFYGTVYNNLITSSNGLVSFNTGNSGQFAHYGMLRDLSNFLNATTGTPENLPSSLYDPALIMGPYHDLNPEYPTSPTRIVQRKVYGTAPHRKWVVSFYKMPLYSISGGCNLLIENTSQIVLYESTGIIEVIVFDKQVCPTWNDGRSIIGIQNAGRNQAMMAPGRKASDAPWGTTGMHEAWRFVPASGASLFKRVELYDASGTFIMTGTAASIGNGKMEASFPNICPVIGTTKVYVIRSVYQKFDDPATEVYGTDTVRITKKSSTNLNASATTTNSGCFAPTGTITVTVPPGNATPPYTFILDGGLPVFGNSPFTLTNVSAGNHTVLVADATLTCSSPINVTVIKNNDLLANNSTTATACAAIANGTITLTPTNGTGPYMYKLDGYPFAPGPVPYTFINVASGAHLVTVTDATGCLTNEMTITVPTGPGVNGNTSSTLSSCAAVANATITATATAGIAPFTWQLDGGVPQTGASPHVFTNVLAGAHTVTIIDNVGCSKSFTVNVNAGPGVNGNTSTTAASCQGINNGTITVNATAGTAPFTFSLDGGPFQSGTSPYTFTNISGGSHFVTIRDNVGCTKVLNLTVNAGAGPLANGTFTATSCNGASNGTLTVTASGGTGPYTFSLDGQPYISGTSPYTFINLSASSHSVIVKDAPGCISNTVVVNIPPGPALTTTYNRTNVLCNGGATGSITINQPALGAAPFQYSIDNTNWQSSNVFTGLVANTYTIYYRSSNGCTGSQQVVITEPQPLTAALPTVPVICNGQSNGIISVSTSGGTTPYSYSIDNGVSWQSSNIFNVPAGHYDIIIKDANNCIITRSADVTEPAVLTATSSNSNATCDGGNNGRIVITANGGNGGYRYSLDGIIFQTSNVFNVAPGNYDVRVKDALGCMKVFNTDVGLTVNLFLNPLTDVSICDGTSKQLQPNTNATIFTWTPSAGLSDTAVRNPVASPAATTKYYLTVVLGRCTTNDSMTVYVNPAPIPDAGPDGDICYGRSYTLQGSGGAQYNWTPALYLNTTVGANPIATPTITTTYTLSVVDAIGCRSLVTDNVKVVVSRPMRINTYPFDTVGYPGQQIQLLATSAGITYTWTPAIRINNTSIPNPVVTVGNIGEDIIYEVVGTTAEGCKGEGYVHIKVSKGPAIYVPTAFTPNNDGKNDKFIPMPVGIKAYKYFKVFNRWGQVIFSTTRMGEGWDGTIAGKEQPSGVYVWAVEGIAYDNRVITNKGSVTLIR